MGLPHKKWLTFDQNIQTQPFSNIRKSSLIRKGKEKKANQKLKNPLESCYLMSCKISIKSIRGIKRTEGARFQFKKDLNQFICLSINKNAIQLKQRSFEKNL